MHKADSGGGSQKNARETLRAPDKCARNSKGHLQRNVHANRSRAGRTARAHPAHKGNHED